MNHQSRRLLPFFLLFAMVGRVAMDLYLPSFPAIEKSLQTTPGLVQLTFTFYLLPFFTVQLLYGPASDRYGRRPVALLGIVIGILGTVVAWLAPDIWILILGRLLQGIGLGVSPLFRPMLRDVFTGEEMARIGALITGSAAVSLAIAPAIGGYIEQYLGWRAVFWILGLYLLTLLGLFWRWLPETNQHRDRWALNPAVLFNKYWLLIRTPLFVGYALCSGLTLAGFASYLAASPYLLQVTIGVSPVTYGWLSWILAGGLATGGFINATVVHHVGIQRVLTLAATTMLGSAVAMTLLGVWWTNVWTVMPAIGLYLVGAGMLFPCATAGALTPFPRIAGAAGALFGTIQMACGFGSSLVISFLPEGTQRPLGYLLVITSAFIFWAAYWAHRHERPFVN